MAAMPDYNLGRAHGTIKIDYEKSGAKDAREDIQDVGDEATKSSKKIDESTRQAGQDFDALGASARKASDSLVFNTGSTEEMSNAVKRLEKDVETASAASLAARAKLAAAEENLERVRREESSTAADVAKAEKAVHAAQTQLVGSVQRLSMNTNALGNARRQLNSIPRPPDPFPDDSGTFDRLLQHLRDIRKNTETSASTLNTFSGRLKLVTAGAAVLAPNIAGLAVSLASLAGLAGVAAGALASLGAVGGTVITGISGVGDAFKAAAAQEKAAGAGAASSAKQQRAAAKSIEQAKRSLQNAEENLKQVQVDAARAAVDALKQVVSAQRDLQDAQRQAVRAQEELNRARQQATRDLEDMQFALTGGSLDERQAILDVKKAQEELNKTKADPTATKDDIEQATINLEKQKLALEETRKANERLKVDATAAAEAGVAGSQAVVNAQDGVRSATQSVSDAQDALAAAQDNVKQVQIDSAKQIAAATQAIVDAQQNLADAYADAADSGSAAGAKMEDALANLSPNARAFVQEVLNLKGAWDNLRKSVQDKLFAGLAAEVQPLAQKWFPILQKGMGEVATALNGIIKETIAYLNTAEAQANVANIFDNTGKALTNLRGVVRDLLAAFLDIASVGSDLLPGLANGAANAAAKFREFIAAAKDSGKLREWMQSALDTAQTLWQLIKNLGSIIGSVFSALDQSGGGALNTLTMLTGELAKFLKSAQGQEALQSLGKILASIGGAVGKVFISFLDVVSGLIVALEPAITSFADSVGVYLAGALQVAQPILQALADVIGFLGPALGPVIAGIYAANKAVQAAKAVWAALNVVMDMNPFLIIAAAIITLVLLIIQNWDSISAYLSKIWQQISDSAVALWTGIVNFFTGIWDTITTGISTQWNAIVSFLENIWNTIKTGVVTQWNAIVNFLKTTLGNIGKFFADRINDIVGFFQELPGKVWKFVSSLPDKFMGLGKDIVMGILRGLGNLASALWNKLKDAVSSAWNSVLDFFGIRSPSKLAQEAGEFIVAGLVRGIDRSSDAAVTAAANMAAAVGNELTGATGTLATQVKMTANTDGLPAALTANGTLNATAGTPAAGVRGGDGAATPRAVNIQSLTLQVQGNLDPTNPVAFRQTIVRLKDAIRNVDKEYA